MISAICPKCGKGSLEKYMHSRQQSSHLPVSHIPDKGGRPRTKRKPSLKKGISYQDKAKKQNQVPALKR